jgi:hypothetical protein
MLTKIKGYLTRAKYRKMDDSAKKEVKFTQIQERSPYMLRSRKWENMMELRVEASQPMLETPRQSLFDRVPTPRDHR